MPLQVYEIPKNSTPDVALMEAVSRTHLRGFLTNKVYQTIYYGPESTHAAIIAMNTMRHGDSITSDPTAHVAVVLDTDLSSSLVEQVVAFIKFNVFATQEAEEERTDADERREWPPGTNVPFVEDFWGAIVKSRERHGSELGPHVSIDILSTVPEHQGRGAGRMLMQYAVKKADELSLPAMLEASPEGAKLYMSCGFVPIGDFWSDLSRYEKGGDKGDDWAKENRRQPGVGEGWYRTLIMKRPKKGEVVETDFKFV